MKKIILVLIISLLTAGCGKVSTGQIGVEKEVIPVVEKYLDYSVAGNWQDVFKTLTGEALAEARANAGRVKTHGKIVSKNFKLTPVGKDIVEVSADFTKKTGEEFERLAYNFSLIKSSDKWLIYKSAYGQYQHDRLKDGKATGEALQIVKEYIELPFRQKRISGGKYLAGKLLQDSLRSAALPVDENTVKEQQKIKTSVKNMQCLGIAEGYALIKVDYDTTRDGKSYPMQAVVEMVDVNRDWKISRIDITKI